MPPTTPCNFGDVILVPFPFTDQVGIKKRPAVVVSSNLYNNARRDLVLIAVYRPDQSFVGFGRIPNCWMERGGLAEGLDSKTDSDDD